MRELSVVEIDEVSGGRVEDAIPYFTMMVGVGVATYGTGWGALAVGAAVAASPVGLAIMGSLAFAGGIAWAKQ